MTNPVGIMHGQVHGEPDQVLYNGHAFGMHDQTAAGLMHCQDHVDPDKCIIMVKPAIQA